MKTIRFIAYYRVSTDKQGRTGLGIEAQQEAVRKHLERAEGELLDSFTEVESGKRNDRPELSKALQRCRLTGATLIIARLDRLSRNKAFLFNLMDSKVKFVCADMPEANDMTISLLAIMADYEAKLISERTKAALAAAKARGVKLGNLATLTNRDTTKAREVHVERSQKRSAEMKMVVQEMVDQDSSLSLRGIAQMLNEAGYTTSRGKQWHATSVNRLLSNR